MSNSDFEKRILKKFSSMSILKRVIIIIYTLMVVTAMYYLSSNYLFRELSNEKMLEYKKVITQVYNGSEVDKETTILNIIRMLIPTHNFEDGFNTELLKASENSDFKISKKWLMEQCDNEYSVEYARSLISKLEKLGINLPETSE